jgi:hypothetical protein
MHAEAYGACHLPWATRGREPVPADSSRSLVGFCIELPGREEEAARKHPRRGRGGGHALLRCLRGCGLTLRPATADALQVEDSQLAGSVRENGGTALDYVVVVVVESRGGHGVHSYGQYDAFRPVHRWIWVGADGSGLIREIAGPYSFYTAEGKIRWEAAGNPALPEGLSDDVFGPGAPRSCVSPGRWT